MRVLLGIAVASAMLAGCVAEVADADVSLTREDMSAVFWDAVERHTDVRGGEFEAARRSLHHVLDQGRRYFADQLRPLLSLPPEEAWPYCSTLALAAERIAALEVATNASEAGAHVAEAVRALGALRGAVVRLESGMVAPRTMTDAESRAACA